MSEPIHRESPLARFDLSAPSETSATGAGIAACERPFLGHLNLRGDPQDERFVAAVRAVLGVAPPITPNTVNEAQRNTVYWLGPDEWLIVTPDERRVPVENGLRSALRGSRFALTDVSGGQTVVVVRGARVRELLAKGCPIDLHPHAFDFGQCAQSNLAKAPILVRPLAGEPAFEIIVRRSFADYLWVWLKDAADEYGFEVLA
jgi:sarcosine oxidase, subunit gamma